MNERWAIYFCIMGNKVSRFLSSIIKMKAFLVALLIPPQTQMERFKLRPRPYFFTNK
jgi:hypothetical protein